MINQPNITNNPFTAASNAAGNVQNNAQNLQQRINSTGNQVNQIAQNQKEKFDNAKKSLEDKQQLVQNQATIDASAVKSTVVSLVLPLLMKFINTERTANVIINKLIRTTKKRLKDKGRVEVNNGTVTFYPLNPGDYSRFKKDFDNKVNKLKQIVKILKTTIDALITVLKIIKTILTALRLQLQLKKKKLLAIAAASGPDLASPSPTKPIAAQYPIDKELNDQLFKDLEDKITNYTLMITVIQSTLQIFQRMLFSLRSKLESLNFNINANSVTKANVSLDIDDINNGIGSTTEYSDGTRNYTIEVVTTSSGALQAIAYDAFSKLKITQTAPSKTRKADELIEELKLILG